MAASVNPKRARGMRQLSLESRPTEQQVDAVLLDRRLTPGARILYHALFRHIGMRGARSPTHRDLARLAGVSARTIRTLVDELKHRGLLRVVRIGCNRPNRYHLLKPR